MLQNVSQIIFPMRRVGLLCAAFILVASCATAAEREGHRWRVLNPNTNPPTPVAGADVILNYTGRESVLVDSFPFCDRVDVVRADEQGWFYVPFTTQRQIVVTAHKAGYAYPGARYISSATKREVYLVPDMPREQRIKQIKAVSDAASCQSFGIEAARLANLLDQVTAEAHLLVREPQDERLIDALKGGQDMHRRAAERGRP